MIRFIEGEDRGQGTLLPELLDDYVAENNPVRVVDAFVDENGPGQTGVRPSAAGKDGATGLPSGSAAETLDLRLPQSHPSSRRLEREAKRNIELMWLTGRLTPDFKTIANFRANNGKAIRNVSRQFIVLC